MSSYVNTRNETSEPGRELEQLLEFHIQDAVKDREAHINSLQTEISQLKRRLMF